MIPAVGNPERPSRQFLHPGPDRFRQSPDLHARVIDVELAGDGVAGPLQQRRDGITESRATAVADVQRTGRVCRHEFDVHGDTGTGLGTTVPGAFRQDPGQLAGKRVSGQPEVDEAGAGDRHRLHDRDGQRQVCHDLVGDGAGLVAEHAGELQREIGGEIAVGRVAGTLEREGDPWCAQRCCHPLEFGADALAHATSALFAFFFGLEAVSAAGAGAFDSFAGAARLGGRGGSPFAFLARTLAVPAVIGDVEAAALEDQPLTAGDDPLRLGATHRALPDGAGGDLLDTLKTVPAGTAVFVSRHRSRPVANSKSGRKILLRAGLRGERRQDAVVDPVPAHEAVKRHRLSLLP